MKLKNGIYIHTENGTLIPLSDAKEDKTALGVVLITEHARIFIDKHEPEYMEWDGAMEFCASEPSYNSEPFRLPDTHEGQEIAFNREQINKAMDLIGGLLIDAEWYWTNQENYSEYAFVFLGNKGYINNNYKSDTGSVRPVSTFER